ncbi:glycine-rich domain-containing protein [Streptomyces rubiginosohelvolus]|uniref:glycine-rich domain-containing protein n=1 Tax=Streptomyces rubiginosohelvolus TaxID=67362 RepID=UPI0036BD9001
MSTAVVIRDPRTYVTPDVWEREVTLLLRNPENTRELAEAKFGQAIAYLVTCGENPDVPMGPSKQVDEAWHSFMLDSIPYHHFTERHFGRYIHHVPELPGTAAEDQCVSDDEATRDGHGSDTGRPLVLEQTITAIKAAGFDIDPGLWGMESAANCNQCHAGCHDSPK